MPWTDSWLKAFRSPAGAAGLAADIRRRTANRPPVRIMEICGTHTMAIAKAGLRTLLAPGVELISGPGCPVCVTPAGEIDAALSLCERPGIILATYGDLMRVPGSVRGDTLLARRAAGADVRTVYSAADVVDLARSNPDHEVVFLGVGFETTTPGTAACVLDAAESGLDNFSVFCLLKRTEPALRALLDAPDCAVDALLCPGHVAAITGAEAFGFLPRDYQLPAVVSGFDAGDVLYSVWRLVCMVCEGAPALENEYSRLVTGEGNAAALAITDQVFQPVDSLWRGLGEIPDSGLMLRPEYARYDAAARYGLACRAGTEPPGCRCGQVIRGMLHPEECPLFGKLCRPEDPVGPCMVSSEGACAAAWKYRAADA